ncbi:metal-dependent transcriptional regulator [Halobacteria archaeon AArc-m2/3/4]|uniref:Metal-dependent transcriptional regulator n=1 Tax=Natronoglomus mannanivorans TaxID=2979990 RepID=A0AAP2Z4A3_9EURY|nr:metal-dependent transcriptional regulator [Halobacteria archaeon AArc-xg1-1]MCU4972822.1 metal-dependent transcriptional regulator [Halobacteria archaeon AArc-m2/3/4]
MELSPVAQDYLKAIYHLEDEHARPVRTVEIADAVGVTSPSVTNMVETLDEHGLVEYTPYKGVELTEAGETVVLNLVRKHRLLETFLTECLDVPWTDVHREADHLEHHLSDELAERLVDFLGEPATDPHGDPIPDTDLVVADRRSYTPLTEYEVGETVVVERVPHRDRDVREHLFENGLEPGTKLSLEAVTPVGIVEVVPDDVDNLVAIPTQVARRIGARAISRGETGLDESNL